MAAAPTQLSWTSLEGRTVIHDIIEERIPEWRTGPRPCLGQLNSIVGLALAGIPTILIASTGWGKPTSFFVLILLLQYRLKYSKTQIP